METQKTIRNIFQEFITKPPQIFKNRDVLTSEFTPETIYHRNKEINTIASILAPSLKGARPSNIFIYGLTGTGKTLVSKHIAEELEKISSQGNFPVKVLYINCKMKKISDTEYRLVTELTRMLGYNLPTTGLPTDYIYQTFFNALDSEKRIIILILDEIDALVEKMGDEFLYNLTRINQDLKQAKLSIIGITNDLHFIEILDPRVKSSLREEEVLFIPYNATQLHDILKHRAQLAFVEEALSEEVIPKCAALAAQEHGDARRALDLLRVAGEIAERMGDNKVTEKHVDMAQEKIDYDRIIESTKVLPKQTKVVLWAILELAETKRDDIQTGDVYDIYQKKCKEIGLYPLTQRRISDLISELDMAGIINAKVTSLGRYGRTRVIMFNLSEPIKQKIKAILNESLVV
ncbi:MAG: ORC1-type DNA replication protein [Candidatus Aenigmarchaeota archaeon]|nr:ORC1-type DNA replication protein [Candidatus Aenigmarchaeota archaeon]MBU5689147.1 ORC1-type DNA replication protein [Candidatus Aenigmarchaeota archaeon]